MIVKPAPIYEDKDKILFELEKNIERKMLNAKSNINKLKEVVVI